VSTNTISAKALMVLVDTGFGEFGMSFLPCYCYYINIVNNHYHLLHSLLPDKNTRTVTVMTCDVDSMIASSQTMLISPTLFTNRFINTVIKHFLLLLFHCLIAFWQFLTNVYVMLLQALHTSNKFGSSLMYTLNYLNILIVVK